MIKTAMYEAFFYFACTTGESYSFTVRKEYPAGNENKRLNPFGITPRQSSTRNASGCSAVRQCLSLATRITPVTWNGWMRKNSPPPTTEKKS